MPEVTGYTTAKVDDLIAGNVVSGAIDPETGELTLTTKDGTIINVGSIVTGISDGSTTVKGVVELATDVETQAGTDGTRAVTPLGVASLVASTTAKGLVELATDAEAVSGTDAVRAVTPHALFAAFASVLGSYQQHSDNLDDIATIFTPAEGDVLEYISGAWVNRTPTQVATTLKAVGVPIDFLHNGTSYVAVNGPAMYVGPVDPGSVANGSVWFDTTGA